MRGFAWVCIVVGVLLAIAVPIKGERELVAFANSTDYAIWRNLDDKVTWQPAGLRTARYWDDRRWPAVIGGGALAALGVLVLAIRKPEWRG
jgi:hypothetical protein